MVTKVTPVQGFKTSDGQLFEDEDTARSAQAKLDLRELLFAVKDHWPKDTAAAIEWLPRNRKLIEDIDLLLQEIY